MLDARSGSMLALGTELLLAACALAGCRDDRVGRVPSTPFVELLGSGAAGTGGSGPGATGGSGGTAGAGAAAGASGGSGGAAGGGLGGAGGAGGSCDPVGQVPDFLLLDKNPNSPSFDEPVSPRDYLQRVSGWFFGYAT